jgi:hypothetical protein
MKTTFPTKLSDYINKYKNVTIWSCWNWFSNPEELNYFTFVRRLVRATWTASYEEKNIWIKNT